MALLAAMQIDMQIDVVVGVKMYLVGMNRTKMGGSVTMTVNHLSGTNQACAARSEAAACLLHSFLPCQPTLGPGVLHTVPAALRANPSVEGARWAKCPLPGNQSRRTG